MKLRNALITVAGMATIFASASVFAPVTLAHTPKEGTETHYKLTGSFDFGGQTAQISSDIDSVVKKVNPDGSFEMTSTQSNMTVNLGGNEITPPASPASVTVYGPDNTIKEIRGEGVTPDFYRLANISNILLPAKPIDKGDTWTVEIPVADKMTPIKTKAVFTYDGTETVDGILCNKIEFVITEEEGDTPGSSKGTAWLSAADSSGVKSAATWTNVTIPGSPVPLSGTASVEIVVPKTDSGNK